MRGFLVSGRGIWRAVGFHEDKLCWVILMLNDIESCDARFLHTLARILQRGGLEGFDVFGFYVDVDVNNEHGWTVVLIRIRGNRVFSVQRQSAG